MTMTAPSDHTPSGQQAVELLPCPFCGGSALVIRCPPERDGQETLHRPQCDSCGADCGGCNTPSEAIALWNRRTAAPTAPSTADTVAVPRSMLAPFVAEAENWADSVPDDYRPLCTEPGKKHAYPGSDTSYSVGDVRRLAAHCAAAPSTPYPLAVTTEMLEAAKEGFHDADENNCDLDDCWGAALTAALGAAPSTVVGEPALVCGCGWEGSYADLNETAEGMTCPKCRLGRNLDCAAALATPPAQMKYGEKTYGEGRDEAANFIFTGLSEALGLDGFTIQDGSETWDGDVRATLMGILRDANVIDEETNERITPPAPSVPWEEQAARWHDKKADWNKQFAAERKGTALADTALNVANRHRCYATQLRTQLRALLSKPAKGEG